MQESAEEKREQIEEQKKMAHVLKIPFWGSIPIKPAIVEVSDEGKPFLSSDAETEGRRKFNEIVDKIIGVTQNGD